MRYLTALLARSKKSSSLRAINVLQSKENRRRLFVEQLEDRRLLATFTVINTDDSGAGSLRQAIVDANSNSGHDEIQFNIAGDGVHTIAPLTGLPNVGDITIDATTQPGFDFFGLHPIELNGENILGIALSTGSGSTMKGLTINRFVFGLNLGEGNRVESNYIGLDPTGTSVVARADDTSENGIWLNGNGNVIGGTIPEHRNVISGWHQGIFNQFGGTNNRIIGNYFSTDKNGQNSFSSWSDLRIFFGDNHIGEPGAGNLIAGTLYLEGGNCTNNLIQGNSISRVVAAHGVNGNLIGGSAIGASNTIVYVQFDSGPFNNKVQGNSIGFVNIFSFEGQFGGDSHHNLIGSDGDGMNDDAEGNVISGGTYNDRYGVLIYGGTGASSNFNEVRGNFIGVSPTGSILVEAPTGYGVQVSGGDSNLIENNVVGGWPVGVYIGDGDSNVVANNRIGTNNQGTQPLPNQVGVELGGSNSRLEHNLISANTKVGLIARGRSNVVAGNFVGTTADGLAALGNGVGIRVEGAATIGGTTPGMGNIVSGNLKEGIGFLHASGAVVQGNYIGVDSTGIGPLGNGTDGISIMFNSFHNTIGAAGADTNIAAANIIAHNGRSGITLSQGERQFFGFERASENAIRGNSIYANAGLGIDLAVHPLVLNNETVLPELGMSPNDLLDADDGANRLQNFPELVSALSAATTRVQGSLHSKPNSTFLLDFYSNSTVDPSGYGEGERFLGHVAVTTDLFGDVVFDVVLAAASRGGEFITATATDEVGNTSEFSLAVQSPLNSSPVANSGGPYSIDEGSSLLLDGSGSFDPDPLDTLTYSWDVNGDGVFGDASGVSPTLTWAQLQVLGINDGPRTVPNVRVRVDDAHAHVVDSPVTTLTVTNVEPVMAGSISGPATAVPGQSVSYSVAFTDDGTLDSHTVSIDWGDGNITSGTVTETIGTGVGTAMGSHAYAWHGTYTITFTLSDDDFGVTTKSTSLAANQSIFVLHTTAAGAFTASGNGTVNVPGVVVVDSNSATAITASGNVHLTASKFNVVGGIKINGNAQVNGPVTNTFVPDPLAGIATPALGTVLAAVSVSGNTTRTINPGTYSSISVSGNGLLTMNPGIYVLAGGGFSVSGNGSVTGSGVSIVNRASAAGSTGAFSVGGNGAVTLTPTTSGPLTGILVFQPANNTKTMTISGNATAGMNGTIYAPKAQMSITGNGYFAETIVVDRLTLSGNGSNLASASTSMVLPASIQLEVTSWRNRDTLQLQQEYIAKNQARDQLFANLDDGPAKLLVRSQITSSKSQSDAPKKSASVSDDLLYEDLMETIAVANLTAR